MTEEDQIKKLLNDELDKRGVEDARVKRIADARAEHEKFARDQSAPREYPSSTVDARNPPVSYVETILPMEVIPFTQPDSSTPPIPPSPVDLGGGEWTTVLYCDSDGGDVLRQVLSRPVP